MRRKMASRKNNFRQQNEVQIKSVMFKLSDIPIKTERLTIINTRNSGEQGFMILNICIVLKKDRAV